MVGVDPPPTGEAEGASGSASDKGEALQSVLNEYYIGMFSLALKDVGHTVLVRPLNPKGLAKIEDSVRQKGWLDDYAPSVIVSRKELEDDENGKPKEDINAELLAKAHARVLDGNHRISVLRKLYGREHRVKCKVYYEFDKEKMQIVADSFNEAAESVSHRGTYDKLYFYNERIQLIQEKTGGVNVSASQLGASYKSCNASAPSEVNLRQWKKAVYGLSEQAFTAIRDLTYCNDSTVDVDAISLAVLQKKQILELKHKPLEQALVMHHIARFKLVNRSLFKHADIAGVVRQSAKCADLRRAVESIVPLEKWTEKLEAEVDKLTLGYMSSTDFGLWVEKHFEDVQNELNDMEKKLPARETLPKLTVNIVKQKLPPRLEKVLDKDPRLRDYLASWKTKYQNVHNDVTRRQLAGSKSRRRQGYNNSDGDVSSNSDSDSFSVSDKDEGEDEDYILRDSRPAEGSRKGKLCRKCQPSAMGRYHCVHCGMKHQSFCALVEHAEVDGEEMLTNKRICVGCKATPRLKRKTFSADERFKDEDNASTKRKGKKKKSDYPTLPTPKPTGNTRSTMEGSRARNCRVNQGNPLQRLSELVDDVFDGDKLRVSTPPKLAIVCAETVKPGLLAPPKPPHQDSWSDARFAVERFMTGMVRSLDLLGTVAFAVPRPWFAHGQRIRELLLANSMVVEDSPLLLHYNTSVGGRRPQDVAAHQRNNVECVLIAHKIPTQGESMTINQRVTVDDVYGTSRGPMPVALQEMTGLTNPGGGPSGGSKCAFPPMALQYLVNRFSCPGDSVLGIGVETTMLAEVALRQSRRVEFYLTDSEYHGKLSKRIDQAFLQAFNAGLFQIDVGTQIFVGPGVLPSGLPNDTTPPRILEALRAGNSMESARTQVAATSEYKLQYCESDGAYRLNLKKAPSGPPVVYDIPIWGELVVYDTPQDALASLSHNELENQLVRLIYIASNHQLRQMLEPGKELCHDKSALYLRVGESNPFYCMSWETDLNKADMDIICFIPRSATLSAMLETVRGNESGDVAVVARLARKQKDHQKHPTRRNLYIFPGDVVVGGPGFAQSLCQKAARGSDDEEGENDGDDEDGSEEKEDGE